MPKATHPKRDHIMTTKKQGSRKKPTTQAKPETAAKQASRRGSAKPTTKGKVAKLSALAAAARVLTEAQTEMNCTQLIETMAAKGYWTSPGGKTPASTLYAAIIRHMATRGKEAVFQKTGKGTFAAKNKA
jgi:hypothetical protein